MNTTDIMQPNNADQKDFWDRLHSEILISNRKLSHGDVLPLMEQNFMFSLFFRGCSQAELLDFQTILNIKDNGYLILVELSALTKSNITGIDIDDLSLHQYLKEVLHKTNNTIGPLITNRIAILITNDNRLSEQEAREDAQAVCQLIMEALSKRFKISASFGVGSIQNINSFHISFIEALSCHHYTAPGKIIMIYDTTKKEGDLAFDYVEAEKHMFDALRLRKNEAFDYFALMMEWIRPMNDDTKRNKILETLVLASYAMRIDNPSVVCFNYMSHAHILMEATEDELIAWAIQSFISITGSVKPQNSIDYTNKIVQATKEYLESHYTDDISLDDIAEQVNISPQYFSKLIKKTTGFNFIDWLSILRVKKAKELLTNSSLTVKEVCFMVGYKDPNYFSRIFKKRIGITPSEFVKSNTFSNKN
ncbi:MAG: hypothetical protein K0S76_142 [Herbinix sp.]|jgi:two-component system response regulator YesN|nr:hypothetical protein [Herbinix sp.]